jgi:hypothetical protein
MPHIALPGPSITFTLGTNASATHDASAEYDNQTC